MKKILKTNSSWLWYQICLIWTKTIPWKKMMKSSTSNWIKKSSWRESFKSSTKALDLSISKMTWKTSQTIQKWLATRPLQRWWLLAVAVTKLRRNCFVQNLVLKLVSNMHLWALISCHVIWQRPTCWKNQRSAKISRAVVMIKVRVALFQKYHCKRQLRSSQRSP